MITYVKQGWKTTLGRFHLVLLLFLYQFVWGLFLYKFIESIVYPLLRRYPGDSLETSASQLFWAESQFRLFKTDMISPYLWIVGGLFLIRMLATPFINAGLYYSIHRDRPERFKFFKGIKNFGGVISIYYWTQILLTLAPAIWFVPKLAAWLSHRTSYTDIAIAAVPYAVVWLLYGFALQLLFLYLQLGKTAELPFRAALSVPLRCTLPIAGVSATLLTIAASTALLTGVLSWIWAGLFALIAHQLYHFGRTVFKIWTIASHYHLLRNKT